MILSMQVMLTEMTKNTNYFEGVKTGPNNEFQYQSHKNSRYIVPPCAITQRAHKVLTKWSRVTRASGKALDVVFRLRAVLLFSSDHAHKGAAKLCKLEK